MHTRDNQRDPPLETFTVVRNPQSDQESQRTPKWLLHCVSIQRKLWILRSITSTVISRHGMMANCAPPHNQRGLAGFDGPIYRDILKMQCPFNQWYCGLRHSNRFFLKTLPRILRTRTSHKQVYPCNVLAYMFTMSASSKIYLSSILFPVYIWLGLDCR